MTSWRALLAAVVVAMLFASAASSASPAYRVVRVIDVDTIGLARRPT